MTVEPGRPGDYRTSCTCEGTTAERRASWWCPAYRCNYSAFNGYRRTPSPYSEIRCTACGNRWRTKAAYADALPRSIEVTP